MNIINSLNHNKWLPPPLGTIVYSNTGNNLTSWTNNGSSISATIGNPSPSIYAPVNKYCYYKYLGNTLINKTISFDVIHKQSYQFFFGCNSSGTGYMFRLETRSGFSSGFASTNSWTSVNGPVGGQLLQKTHGIQLK